MSEPATVAPFPGNGDPPLLLDAGRLATRFAGNGPPVRVLDLAPLRTYRRGHVPGAVHGWWQDTMEWNRPVYGTILRPDDTQQARTDLLRDLGIDDETSVVVYDDARNRWAAHMVWFLRFLGHDDAAVLDGGLGAWRGAGYDIERGERDAPAVEPPTVVPREGYYVTTDDLLPLLADPRTRLIDIRSPEEVTDDVNGTLPLGRIPGAIPIPWTDTLRDRAGRLHPPERLARLYRERDVLPDHRVITYARFGVEAAHGWWVLKMLGYPEVMTYNWGWADWATRPDLEIVPLT